MGSTMKKFTIKYLTLEGDISNVWLEAYDKDDAKIRLKQEYWDVREIISVYNE